MGVWKVIDDFVFLLMDFGFKSKNYDKAWSLLFKRWDWVINSGRLYELLSDSFLFESDILISTKYELIAFKLVKISENNSFSALIVDSKAYLFF